MIRNKTVIVVAAGASNDLGLPLGPDLQAIVANLLERDNDLFRYFVAAARQTLSKDDAVEAHSVGMRARRMSKQLLSAASIDNFLDQHRDDEDLVSFIKIVIAYALADAEKASQLSARYTGPDLFANTSDYFMFDLLNIAVRGHQAQNMSESLANMTFVIFNYDRCVERYLDLWLDFRFSKSLATMDARPKFIHVYGSLGDYFAGQHPSPFDYRGDFAFQNPHLELPAISKEIKIFTEQEESQTREDISQAISEATALIFLGFGFEEQNMRFFDGPWSGKHVFATSMGLSDQNEKFVRDSLVRRFSNSDSRVHTLKTKSKGLFRDLYHAITNAVRSI